MAIDVAEAKSIVFGEVHQLVSIRGVEISVVDVPDLTESKSFLLNFVTSVIHGNEFFTVCVTEFKLGVINLVTIYGLILAKIKLSVGLKGLDYRR